MYDILSGAEGDYAIDEVVPDFEKTDASVLAMQTRDMEERSLEELEVLVKECVYDLMTSAFHLNRLQFASESLGLVNQTLTAESSCAFRKSIQSRYPMTLAMETIYQTTRFQTVSVLESETNEERNLFQRILDKIVEMFTWVWKKVKKLFGIKRDNKKLKEEKETEIKEIEEIEKAGVHAEEVNKDTDIDFEKFCEAFGFLSNNLAPSVIATFLDDQARDIVLLKNLSDASADMFKAIITSLERPHVTAKEVRATVNQSSDRIKNLISGFETLSKINIEEYGGTHHRLAGFNKQVVKMKSNFIFDQKLIIVQGWDVHMAVHESTRDLDGFDVYYATFGTGEPLKRNTEVKIPNSSELKVLARQLVSLDSSKAKNYYEITQTADQSIQQLSMLQQKAKSLTQSGSMNERELAFIMNQVGLSMTSLITTVARAGRAIEDTVQTVDTFVRHVNRAYKKVQKEKKAA